MKSVKGTKTEQNLLKSFAGESQARNRYTFFAKKARKEGLEEVARIFEITADQERVHAQTFFDFLEGGDLEITATFPAGKVGTTMENLKAAAAGENEEWTELYPEFAKIAEEEGFPKIAAKWKMISVAEKYHEDRYNKLVKALEAEEMFQSNEKIIWYCMKCGFIHEATKPPKSCPSCAHPQGWFSKL